jgi:hypothetical protein
VRPEAATERSRREVPTAGAARGVRRTLRIPRRKLYRAFSELDPYSDELCEQFMQRVRVRTSYRGTVTGVSTIVCIVSLALTCGTLEDLAQSTERLLGHVVTRQTAELIALGLCIAMVPGVPALAFLITRDLVLWASLRTIIRQRIDRIRCLSCKYVLLGQRVADGVVTCPECGASNTLAVLGVSAADLIPSDDNNEYS